MGMLTPVQGGLLESISAENAEKRRIADMKSTTEQSKRVADLQGLASASNAIGQGQAQGLSPYQSAQNVAGQVADTNASTFAQMEANRRGLESQALAEQGQLAQNQAQRDANLMNQIVSGGAGFLGALAGGGKK